MKKVDHPVSILLDTCDKIVDTRIMMTTTTTTDGEPLLVGAIQF
jgi:hypothetical protein